MLLLSTNTCKQGYIIFCVLFFPAQEQTVMISTRVFSPPLLTHFPLFISKLLSFLLSTAWHLRTVPVFPYICDCISLAGEAIYKYT